MDNAYVDAYHSHDSYVGAVLPYLPSLYSVGHLQLLETYNLLTKRPINDHRSKARLVSALLMLLVFTHVRTLHYLPPDTFLIV